MATSPRQYDLVLLGATGFTGKLTAERIAKTLPTDLKWAIAGRNSSKLADVSRQLEAVAPNRTAPGTETLEHSPEQLRQLALKTRVLITTLGPFHRFGTPVIEACAHAGTHYLDSTGETAWVYEVAERCHAAAQASGAILIPHCAMDSAPADLAAYALASFVRHTYSSGTAQLAHSVQEFENGASGSTLRSLLGVASSYSMRHMRESARPHALCAGNKRPTAPHRVPRSFSLGGSHRVPRLGLLTDSLLAVPDTTLVYRSWSLMDGGELYGPGFSYFTGMKAANRLSAFLWHYALALAMPMLLFAPARWMLLKMVPPAGEGPSEEARANDHTSWTSIAYSDSNPSQGAVCHMAFPNDMYSLTAILLSEAAGVLLYPDRPNWAQKLGSGVLTPATLGDQFIEKVKAAGMTIEVEPLKA